MRLIAIAMSIVVASVARAECNGFEYRSKDDGVPVYDEPDTASRVVRKLALGDVVCRIGEQNGFAILSGTDSKLEFVRSAEIWTPDPRAEGVQEDRSILDRIRGYFQFIQSGGVPEDGLLPYRGIIGDYAPDSAPSATPHPK